MKKSVVSAVTALCCTSALGLPLPPQNPVVYSQVYGSTSMDVAITLWDSGETFNSYQTPDGDSAQTFDTSLVQFNRPFAQYGTGSPTIDLAAKAQSGFGVNKVYLFRDGAALPGQTTEYGTQPANQFRADWLIDNTDWWTWNSTWDNYNGRWTWAPTSFVSEDTGSEIQFGTLDPGTGSFVQSTTHTVQQHSGYSGDAYLLPNGMPVITLNRNHSAYVTATSRWENIFYFHDPALNGTSGTATFTIEVDGSFDNIGDGGYWQFIARDWEHKDQWGTYLGYEYESLLGDGAIGQTIDVTVPFIYGTPQYVKAELWASLWGEGEIDLFNTAQITSVSVPEGTAVYSYGDFLAGNTTLGFAVVGGLDGGTLGGGAGQYFAGLGGGGGGGSPVPLPPALWLFAAAAGMIVRTVRRPATTSYFGEQR